MESEILELLERGVAALEKMNEEPQINFEVGPAFCPNCEAPDPVVKIPEGAEGPISECIVIAECQHCHVTFYAIPLAWSMQQSRQRALLELDQRRAVAHGSDGNSQRN